MDDPFKYGLLAGLAIALLVAAFTDLRSRQIGNWLNAAIALGAPLYWWAAELALWPDVGSRLIGTAVAFAVLAFLFARGKMGGGDVKLLLALALWVPPLVYIVMAFLAALVGGCMSMLAGTRNLADEHKNGPRARIAVIGSALWILGACYFAWTVNGGQPISPVAALEGYAPGWLARATVAIVVVALLLFAALSAIVIARSQKSRVDVPYGLAISTGGLLIILAQFIPLLGGPATSGSLG